MEIAGRVQGVHYRSTIANIANSLNIKGYVESENDGILHAVAQGSRDNLEEFIKWCQRGSLFSKVEGLSYKFTKTDKKFEDFEIKTKKGIIKDQIIGIKNLGKRLIGQGDTLKVPNHIVIIPDGNRRWARSKSWHPWVGHMQAVRNKDRILDLFTECAKLGVKYVTLWGFSTENWKRDDQEVKILFNLFRKGFKSYLEEFKKNGVRFRHIGRTDRIPEDVMKNIKILEEETKDLDVLNVQFALDYGGRDELIRAIQKMQKEGVKEFNETEVPKFLDTAGLPDPDLLIRTGGEKRTSGMMIWQSDYTELYFTDVLFPDFTAQHLKLAVLDYSFRTRRFGGTAQEDLKNIDLNSLTEPEEKELAQLALNS